MKMTHKFCHVTGNLFSHIATSILQCLNSKSNFKSSTPEQTIEVQNKMSKFVSNKGVIRIS